MSMYYFIISYAGEYYYFFGWRAWEASTSMLWPSLWVNLTGGLMALDDMLLLHNNMISISFGVRWFHNMKEYSCTWLLRVSKRHLAWDDSSWHGGVLIFIVITSMQSTDEWCARLLYTCKSITSEKILSTSSCESQCSSCWDGVYVVLHRVASAWPDSLLGKTRRVCSSEWMLWF
jgi:hypothetical protein